ncbi:MAG TPA: UvrD-helicase domain-containing protein [Armatimonadota bacterium]|nr:UvrD-helicase domain-containing protein [Armatimonadota bacterium]
MESLGNRDQIRIVTQPLAKNLLIFAGPGSGKTRTIVHRCAYLLRVKRVRPRAILVCCFNHRAALELRRRLGALVGRDALGVTRIRSLVNLTDVRVPIAIGVAALDILEAHLTGASGLPVPAIAIEPHIGLVGFIFPFRDEMADRTAAELRRTRMVRALEQLHVGAGGRRGGRHAQSDQDCQRRHSSGACA